MKINKLRVKNMYGIKGDMEYDLSPHIIGVFGNNGAGKSSLINALKFAISGEKTPTTMLCGSGTSAVRIQMDNMTIDRMLTRTETGSQLTSWENGKKTPGSRIQSDLAAQLNTTKDNLKILSSKDISSSLAENAGKILLSFADDELTNEEVVNLLYNNAEDTTDFNKEKIKELSFPEHIMWKTAEEVASSYRKKTRELRSEIKGMEAAYTSIRFFDTGDAEIPAEDDARKEYDGLVKKEALCVEGQKLLENYEKLNSTRENILKSIRTKEEELKTFGDTRDVETIKAEKEQLIAKGNELNKQIASANGTVSALQPLYEKMGTGICPLSCNGIEIKCCTDMTDTKNSVKKQIDDASLTISKCMEELKEAKEAHDAIVKELALAEKKSRLQTEIDSMKKAVPEKAEKPAVSVLSDEEKARKQFLSNAIHNMELKARQKELIVQINEKKKDFFLNDYIAKQFSQKGVVSQTLFKKYVATLTDAAGKAEAETGVRVVFKIEDGLNILYSVGDDVERSYETLSEGEKMLAFLTVSDLLYRIANIPILLLDDVDKLDADNFDHMLTLIERVADSYQNIIIAGVDHEEFKPILEKHSIPNIFA